MFPKKCKRVYLSACMLAVIAVLAGSANVFAQAKPLLSWQEDLARLQNASNDELAQNLTAVQQIRRGVEFYLKFHLESKATLPDAPTTAWSVADVKKQVAGLSETIAKILANDADKPFNLGVTVVSVTAEASPLSPSTDTLAASAISERQLINVAQALQVMPGVSIDPGTGQRNEAMPRVRGFSARSQVPFYLDGIPVYIPYDGYVDFNRFLSSDISEIQVDKGYSSPTLGPNGLAGSINLVTKEPKKKFEADGLLGTASGDTLLSSLRLGSRFSKFYVQGSVDWYQQDFIPLSGNFPLNKLQTTDERNNSASRDEKFSGRAAWTPKGDDQYSFSFVNQKGQKDGLNYIGVADTTTYKNFWKWPYWNKTGYYLITNTGIGESSSLKFRGFYDQFRNQIDMYDDATYSTMKKSSSEHSSYNDHTWGASTEFDTKILPRNNISASFFIKDDWHQSEDIYPTPAKGTPSVYPLLTLREQQYSIGLQDIIPVTQHLRVTVGFNADYLKGMHIGMYNTAKTAEIPITCFESPTNASFSGCGEHSWTYNPQISASYVLTMSDTVFAIFSDRGRFPNLKETYSYKFLTAAPNPELGPERSRNWDLGYSHGFGGKTVAQVELFRSNLRDAIQSIYVVDAAGICTGNNGAAFAGYCSQSYNIGKEVHEGAEISVRSNPISRVSFDASYSFINRTLEYDWSNLPLKSSVLTTVATLTSMPKNKVVSNLTVELPRRILGMATFRYEGGIRIQDTNIIPLPNANGTSFGVVDLGVIVPIKAGIKAQAGVKNLFDRDYYYSTGYPEMGRSGYVNVRFQY